MSFGTYRIPSGQSGLEALLRSLIEDVRRSKICESSTIRVEPGSRGQMLSVKEGKGGGSSEPSRRFVYKSMTDEYLVCRQVMADGSQGETDILVAKDHDLRVSSWNGQTIVHRSESTGGTRSVSYTKLASDYRTAVSAGVTEYQAIRPQFVPDRTIIVATKPDNGTGINGVEWMQNGPHAWAQIG